MYRSPRGVTPDQQTDKESPLIDQTVLDNVLWVTLDYNQLLTRLWIAVISRTLKVSCEMFAVNYISFLF